MLPWASTCQAGLRSGKGAAAREGALVCRASITGWGMYAPARIVTNAELAASLDTSDEWIVSRTGIRERRIAAEHETTATMAVTAGRAALDRAGVTPGEVDLIIVATSTPDCLAFPSTACLVQAQLGARNAAALDIGAACAGFVYGLATADSFVRSGSARCVLLIGSETFSRILDWTDRTTCVLFGDGAGAVLLQPSEDETGVLGVVLGADGCGAELLHVPAGGSKRPASHTTVDERLHFVKMDGKAVFKFSVTIVPETARRVLDDVGLPLSAVALIIPHQANMRIVQTAAKRLGLPVERFYTNLDRYGNTSAASIPMALTEAIEERRLQPGEIVLFVGFGGGLTWGGAAVRWGAARGDSSPGTSTRELPSKDRS